MPTTERPLAAKRIVVTRSETQSGPLLDALRLAGALPFAAPAIRVIDAEDPSPLVQALAALDTFDWLVCTSANAARRVLAQRARSTTAPPAPAAHGDWPARCRIATVGGATSRVFDAAARPVDFTPSRALADVLADELPLDVGMRVLWPRGDLASVELRDRLLARGAAVTDVIAYRTVADVALLGLVDAMRDGRVDALTFTSASTVRHVVEGLAAARIRIDQLTPDTRPRVVCLGPVTAAAARECGLRVDAVADRQDDAGLVEALVRVFSLPSALH